LKLNRDIFQITNGGGGAKYSGNQVETPWSDNLIKYNIPPSFVLINVKYKTIKLKVINPESFEVIDDYVFAG
jgi:hypothetical protein